MTLDLEALPATRAQRRRVMGARLARLLIEARRRYEAMTPAERQAMHEAQRESWVRGEMEMLRHEREMTRRSS